MNQLARVGIYSRVSTKDQTPENQLLDLRKFCEARQWQIVAERVDHGISGARDDRPALKEIMDMARKRRIDILLVHRFDRLARSLRSLINTLEELRALGVAFVSFSENLDTSNAQGLLIFSVVAAIAEFERSILRDRVLSGLRRAVAQGKRLGRPTGLPPKAQEAMRLRKDGQSIRQIAGALGVARSTVARWVSQKTP